MDSGIVTQTLLLTLCGMVLGAFLAYSVTIIYKLGFTTYLKMIGQMGKAISGALTRFATSLIGLLAASAQTSSSSTEKKSDITGVYNFRTRKFDNGTDPNGWYEEDL